MKAKVIIICIVGESGSGKTMIAEALEQLADIPLIRSYTDRPKRTPTENGHTFLSKEVFDLLDESQMIASTNWNGYRYCCLAQDLKPVNTYVIDCNGLEMLKTKYGGIYNIISIRIKRSKTTRIKVVGNDRVARDDGKFYLPDGYFDYVVYNVTEKRLDVITEVWRHVRNYVAFSDYLSQRNIMSVLARKMSYQNKT